MALLTKDDILKANDIKTKRVQIKDWGGEVIISTMSAERHAMFEQLASGKSENDALAYYAVSILVNEDGSSMFDSIEDLKALSKKSSSALMQILSAGLSLNNVTDKDIKEIAKKSTTVVSQDT